MFGGTVIGSPGCMSEGHVMMCVCLCVSFAGGGGGGRGDVCRGGHPHSQHLCAPRGAGHRVREENRGTRGCVLNEKPFCVYIVQWPLSVTDKPLFDS